ncbi:MAG: hypothetical protein CR981_00835 [Proteobacteria bacterium]|nr:MAG: hypothetical protein CR981_00835 [Pseudomonadota bacterium]
MSEKLKELDDFIDQWPDSMKECRQIFLSLKELLQHLPQVSMEFIARPGVSYSLRGVHQEQQDKPLFVMVDVIDDDPRWLSVCFYGEMVTDPDECGDFVPGGLLGADAVCFDIESDNATMLTYVKERIREAHAAS